MFADRVVQDTGQLYNKDNHSKLKSLYVAEALKNVEKNLTTREILSVATIKERWDTGLRITPLQKCMHNEVKLAMFIGFLDRDRDLNITSASICWKELGKFEGFDDWVSKENSAPGDEPVAGGSDDLFYKVPLEYVNEETSEDPSTILLVTVFSPSWPVARMCPAWRLYAGLVLRNARGPLRQQRKLWDLGENKEEEEKDDAEGLPDSASGNTVGTQKLYQLRDSKKHTLKRIRKLENFLSL
ncbi:hypothetical protein FIBSPDRAFT_886290 [Athelia psychrophila]|uniref:Uncharacterized protein n=1 Tax=Athelia psychrophila TaxID=1759441 RepID=A0A166QZF6_9AGAM|nr:hypothetical protein FIBSPDRAFT_886290 [Fibularhizoctonia sp. CBS 109695]